LVRDQGQIALKISLGENDNPIIKAYKLPEKKKKKFTTEEIRKEYLYQSMDKEMKEDDRAKLNLLFSGKNISISEKEYQKRQAIDRKLVKSFNKLVRFSNRRLMDTRQWNDQGYRSISYDAKGNLVCSYVQKEELYQVFGKYKPVAKKVKPILGEVMPEFRIE
jgi:hypothetical protein